MKFALVPAYLLHSYLYYILDYNVIADEEFDEICNQLLEKWDEVVVPHRHGHLLDKDALRAGSGFQISDADYPEIIRHHGAAIKAGTLTWERLIGNE